MFLQRYGEDKHRKTIFLEFLRNLRSPNIM